MASEGFLMKHSEFWQVARAHTGHLELELVFPASVCAIGAEAKQCHSWKKVNPFATPQSHKPGMELNLLRGGLASPPQSMWFSPR